MNNTEQIVTIGTKGKDLFCTPLLEMTQFPHIGKVVFHPHSFLGGNFLRPIASPPTELRRRPRGGPDRHASSFSLGVYSIGESSPGGEVKSVHNISPTGGVMSEFTSPRGVDYPIE